MEDGPDKRFLPQNVLKTITLSQIRMRPIVWLEKPLMLDSAFTLVAGPKGVGKGTWLAAQIAKMTTGGFGRPGDVLVISSEDSPEEDLKPRCAAAEANMDMVHLVQGRFTLPQDNEKLYHAALDCQARMVVIDPLANHLNGANTDSEGQVRTAIEGLNRLANAITGVVLGVRHLSKQRDRGALASVLGSTAWVDLPRSVLMFAPDDENDMLFHVQVVAGNRAGRSAGQSYRMDLVHVHGPDKEPVTRAVAVGESMKDIEDLLAAPRRSSKSDSARKLILDILDNEGDQGADALDARVAQETGVAAKTVQNIRGELRNAGLIKPYPLKDEGGQVKKWMVKRTQAPRPDQIP